MADGTANQAAGRYPTTMWTQVIDVIQKGDGDLAWAALSEFCQSYRPAVLSFFRRHSSSPEQAEDYTQAFFESRILKRWEDRAGFLHSVERTEGGRFRAFLAHVLWRFLQDEWKKDSSQRGGKAIPHVPWDELQEGGAGGVTAPSAAFGREFDQAFALEIIQKAARRSRHSQHLMAHLQGELSQVEAAAALGLSANAFKAAYFRFRERLAEDLREEVQRLVGVDAGEVRAEILHLMSLFADAA